MTPCIVILIKDSAIQTIRPVASTDIETREAETIIDRIAPAIKMMTALLRDEPERAERA